MTVLTATLHGKPDFGSEG